MQLQINGQSREFAALQVGATVADLIVALEIKADRVAVERNGDIVARAAWTQITVSDGDRFEIVHFVGGGSC